MSEPRQWPPFADSYIPWDPAPTFFVLLVATVVVVVFDATPSRVQQGWARAVTIGLAVLTPLVAGVGGLVAGLASPDQWPPALQGLPVAPSTAFFILLAVSVVLAGVGAWWNTRPGPVTLAGLFAHAEPPRSPASLLRADQHVVRFRGAGRERLLQQLHDWCTDEQAPRVDARVITGAGGQGKTRIATELIARLQAMPGWRAGIVDRTADREAIAELERLRQPVLLVVDHAESRADQLEAITKAIAHTDHPVRLLLLARADGDWRENLTTRSATLQDLFAHCPIHTLEPVEPDPQGRAAAWRDAVADLAQALTKLPTTRHTPWPDLAGGLVPPQELHTDRYAPVLAIHMHALAALLNAGQPDTGTTGTTEDDLLRHEQRYWKHTATARLRHRHGWRRWLLPARALDLSDRTLKHAVAVAALFGAANRREALAIINALPGVRDRSEDDRSRVADWLATVYPAANRFWGPLQPDLLAEHLAATVLADQPDALDQPARQATRSQWTSALDTLARATVNRPDLAAHIQRLVTANPATAGPAAMTVAATTQEPQPLIRALTTLAGTTADIELLTALHDALPRHTLRLRELATHVLTALTANLRPLAQARPDRFLPDLARASTSLSNRLAELGRREEALAAVEEAVSTFRQLAQARPDAFLPDLAMSLNSLSNGLAGLGRREEALAAVEEAVSAYRQLAQAEPDRFLPNLAASLNDLSLRLAELGRREEALAAVAEAVSIYRQLAPVRPEVFLDDLARALNNFSNHLAGLDRREGAVSAVAEEVTTHPQTAQARPEVSLPPDLARAWNDLSFRLAGLGPLEATLAAVAEEVTTHPQARPDVFLYYCYYLAGSLEALCVWLAIMDRREEAVTALAEEVTTYRRLTQARPDVFLPDLAQALDKLSNHLSGLDRGEEALTAIEEAVSIYRGLAQDRPDRFLNDLTRALNRLSDRLADLGRMDDAARVASEAADIIDNRGDE